MHLDDAFNFLQLLTQQVVVFANSISGDSQNFASLSAHTTWICIRDSSREKKKKL